MSVLSTPYRFVWNTSASSRPWINDMVLSGGASFGSPWPSGPWHFAHLRSKSFPPAWIAAGFPASGLTVADCWATTSNVVLNTTDAATSAEMEGLDIGPVRHRVRAF